jgi:hypothetical protein
LAPLPDAGPGAASTCRSPSPQPAPVVLLWPTVPDPVGLWPRRRLGPATPGPSELGERHRGARGRRPPLEPMWLWASDPAAGQAEVAVLWQAYLRRSGQEHCVRFLKSRLGWSRPLLRDRPRRRRQVDLADHRLLRPALARPPLAVDARLPWQRPQPSTRATRTRTDIKKPL